MEAEAELDILCLSIVDLCRQNRININDAKFNDILFKDILCETIGDLYRQNKISTIKNILKHYIPKCELHGICRKNIINQIIHIFNGNDNDITRFCRYIKNKNFTKLLETIIYYSRDIKFVPTFDSILWFIIYLSVSNIDAFKFIINNQQVKNEEKKNIFYEIAIKFMMDGIISYDDALYVMNVLSSHAYIYLDWMINFYGRETIKQYYLNTGNICGNTWDNLIKNQIFTNDEIKHLFWKFESDDIYYYTFMKAIIRNRIDIIDFTCVMDNIKFCEIINLEFDDENFKLTGKYENIDDTPTKNYVRSKIGMDLINNWWINVQKKIDEKTLILRKGNASIQFFILGLKLMVKPYESSILDMIYNIIVNNTNEEACSYYKGAITYVCRPLKDKEWIPRFPLAHHYETNSKKKSFFELIPLYTRGFRDREKNNFSSNIINSIPHHRYCAQFDKKIYTCDECAICLEEFNEDDKCSVLTCGHIYHAKCLININKCPICRHPQ